VLLPADQPVGLISPQPWLTAPQTRRVMTALNAGGRQARFVGGCVRDGILNRPVRDVDIATPDDPAQVMRLLEQAGIKAIPSGIEHGTVTAVVDGQHFEITTLRRDEKTDGRHAVVAFTDDWHEDASRRDFTINSMSADIDGNVWDPFDGLADLGIGAVRFIGNPEQRIEEDVLRLLRFFRFHAHYGRGPLDDHGMAACRKLAGRLVELSAERVAAEVLRLLEAPDPVPVLLVMRAEGILAPILPELQAMDWLKLLVWLETRAMVRPGVGPDPIRRLAGLLPGDADAAAHVAGRLRLSNQQVDRIAAIAGLWPQIGQGMEPKAARKMLRRWGAERFTDGVLVSWADQRRLSIHPNSSDTSLWMGLIDLAQDWQGVTFPLRGQDALDMGLKPGPRLGTMLAQVEAWWEENDYGPDREACLARLRELIAP
jgi:poly(A) polymerase